MSRFDPTPTQHWPTVCQSENQPMGYNFGIGWQDGGKLVRSYRYVQDTVEIFRDTIALSSTARSMTGKGGIMTYEDGGDVFCRAWNAVDRTWSAPETLNYDTLSARYPHVEVDQFTDGVSTVTPARFSLWTQQVDDTLYELGADIKRYEGQGEVGVSPYAYLKMGKEHATAFTVHRDGIKSYGAEEYMKIDSGYSYLQYRLPYVKGDGTYRLFLECFFNDTVPSSPWQVGLVLNGQNLGAPIYLYKGQLHRSTVFIPGAITGQESLSIVLTRLDERNIFVPCSRIAVSSFVPEGEPASVSTRSQSGQKTERLPQIFALHQNAPSPARGRASIRYDLPRECHVLLCAYDAIGRTVCRMVDRLQRPGRYTVALSDKDDGGRILPTGIYFYRMLATGDDGKVLYCSSRKMILIRQ